MAHYYCCYCYYYYYYKCWHYNKCYCNDWQTWNVQTPHCLLEWNVVKTGVELHLESIIMRVRCLPWTVEPFHVFWPHQTWSGITLDCHSPTNPSPTVSFRHLRWCQSSLSDMGGVDGSPCVPRYAPPHQRLDASSPSYTPLSPPPHEMEYIPHRLSVC